MAILKKIWKENGVYHAIIELEENNDIRMREVLPSYEYTVTYTGQGDDLWYSTVGDDIENE
jgi:hypothetical protein